jgi:hypothetical protein
MPRFQISARVVCLKNLPHFGVTTAQGEARFILRERAENFMVSEPGVMLQIDPEQLHPGVPMVHQRRYVMVLS